ncbi:Mediator complex subunit Med10 [Penicillium brevicompactum]|uniref:Mediator of RNA polymerase II transcription subunit 10 n=1 Tax=Penicillium brevicompactum TaxID=5074 RepID=A0A9W9UXK1_PENBR|nr:Mediator complex subunit Med10 [Penicillium brevicompactum]
MAPVTLKTIDDDLKDAIQHLFEMQSAVHGYLGPETQQELTRKLTSARPDKANIRSESQKEPHSRPLNTFNTYRTPQIPRTPTRIRPLQPSARQHSAPPEIIDYVDSARNPDIYTREFVELVQRGNQDLHGKRLAFAGFRDVLAREMRSAMPECRAEVDRAVKASGGKVEEETGN